MSHRDAGRRLPRSGAWRTPEAAQVAFRGDRNEQQEGPRWQKDEDALSQGPVAGIPELHPRRLSAHQLRAAGGPHLRGARDRPRVRQAAVWCGEADWQQPDRPG